MRHRLDPEVFELPVEKIRDGYYTDAYFNHTRSSLLADRHPRVLLQVFQKEAVLGGMDEAVAILKLSHGYDDLEVRALHDGDLIAPWETVLTIEGDYTLPPRDRLPRRARARTLISTNVRRVVEAANGKEILYFPARHDHHRVQTGDGYGARRGRDRRLDGRPGLVVGRRGIGTVPHGLIAAYGGDTVLAARTFAGGRRRT